MLLNVIHKIVSYPKLYDISQWCAGVSFNREIIRKEFAELQLSGCILDVGGGTGLSRTLIPAKWKYFCLDPDPQKLEGFRAKYPSDEAVQASACDIPLPNESFDLCIMVAVSHHLTEAEFRLALSEIERLLRPGGEFMLMDAVWNSKNLRGRFLWSLDRGSYPKSRETLINHLEEYFSIKSTKNWKVHHEYSLFWCQKKQ